MRLSRRVVTRSGAGLTAAVAFLALSPPTGQSLTDGIPARIVTYDPPSFVTTYPMIDYGRTASAGDDRAGDTRWRIVENTGNCCENYVTIARNGRLMDFGGRYINYTDDRGKTWRQVQPVAPLVNGEGAIVMGLDGDVLGVEWDPYTADHLQVYKFDGDTRQWLYNEMPLHQPFYDREWIAVVPGPVTIRGETFPWVSFIKGGYPTKEAWYYSTDGLNYLDISSKVADGILSDSKSRFLNPTEQPINDWIQPNANAGITPLGRGAALGAPDFPSLDGEWSLLDGKTFRWAKFRYGDGSAPRGYTQVDSAGRLHELSAGPFNENVVYRMSDDGGRTWSSLTLPLPANTFVEESDFRANRSAGIAAVGLHAHDESTDRDRDLLYKIGIRGERPRLLSRHNVGLGDVDGASGVGASVRFDFETVAVFPDGRVAMSFYDTTTADNSSGRIRPALAIEMDTTLR